MRPKFLFLALPALLAIVLVASGCGGGDSSSTTTKKKPAQEETVTKLTKGQFISQGDAICAEVNTAVGSVQASPAEATSQTTQIANLYSGMVQSLQRLGQPAEIEGYSDFMGAAERLAMTQNEVKSAGEAENPALVEEASQATAPAVEEFQQQAAVYGFEECSEGPRVATVAPESSSGTEEIVPEEESGGIEVAPEEEIVPEEEEVAPEIEEEIVPEEEEVAPETGGAGGGIEEAPEEVAPEEGSESGGIGPG